jgi:alpha-D-xyloside xylohydrolase
VTGPELLLHDFSFNGEAVPASKLHLRQLSPGVVEITSVAYAVGEWRFRVRDSANYYGLGERFNALNHSHTIVRNASEDNASTKGSATYKPIPFFMSTSGYGLWVDTTGEAVFDMNAASQQDILITEPAEKLRLVLFTGPEFPKILDHFTALAGRAIVPPYWAFAPWKGRDFHRNDAEVREDVEETRALGLPASVIVIDSPWAGGYNNYIFNPKQFADAPAMVKNIHAQGFKLVLWHTSWINSKTKTPGEDGFANKIDVKSSNYDEAAAAGYFVMNPDGTPWVGTWWKGQGSMIDFTNPRAKAWWQGQVRKAITAGADGFKDDDAEGGFQGDAVRFADGSDRRLMRNRYGMLYNNAMEELIQKDLKGNGVLFARSVTTGANGIGFLWGGDNDSSFSRENGLPTVVTAGLGAGLSGMPLWTADLGGYLATPDTPNAQLFQRWTEYAAFAPAMEILSTSNLGPWDYGEAALATYKKFAILHMSLFPYRYAAAQEAARTGMPLMRALVLNYQNDADARIAPQEYLFGPDLLVAPVVDQNTSRPVYLPGAAEGQTAAAQWMNLWTGEVEAGGHTIIAKAAMDSIPVYIRAGAVLPKIPEDVMTLVPSAESGNTTVHTLDDRRIYEVYGATGSATLTDFEGRNVSRDGSTLKISGGKPAKVTVRLRFAPATQMMVDGRAIPVHTDASGPSIEFPYTGGSTSIDWR